MQELSLENSNPIPYFGKLLLGIIGIILSILWWLHMYY